MTMKNGPMINPDTAASAPIIPPKRLPTIRPILQTVGPGSIWLSAIDFANSSAVSHLCCSTSARYANGITPPKPISASLENTRKIVAGDGWSVRAVSAPAWLCILCLLNSMP